jgi:hypothetical protein
MDGEQYGDHMNEQNAMSLADKPVIGDLRMVDHGCYTTLQQLRYSSMDGREDWFDVPIVSAADLVNSAQGGIYFGFRAGAPLR